MRRCGDAAMRRCGDAAMRRSRDALILHVNVKVLAAR
jgi:hypothetical protein